MVGGKLSARLLDVVSFLVLARVLDPEDFGLVGIATAILVMVEAVLDIPLVQALLRQRELTERMLSTALTLGVLRSAAIFLVMMGAAFALSASYGDERLIPLVIVMAGAPMLRSVVSPGIVVFMRAFDFRRDFLLDITAKAVALATAATIALFTGSYWALAAGALAGQVASTTLSYILAPLSLKLSLSEWRLFQDMIGWNSASQIVDSLNWQMDRLLLPRFIGISAFGGFSVADTVAGVPHQTLVNPLMRPLMAGFATLDSQATQRKAFLKAVSAATLVAAPVLLVLALLADPIVRVMVGEKWAGIVPVLQMLCIGSVIGIPSTVMPSLVMVLDKTRYVTARMVIEFMVRAPATLIGITYFGLYGALYARLCAVLVACGASIFVVRRLLQAPVLDQILAFLRPLVAALPMVALLISIQPSLRALAVGPTLIGALAIASGAALALFWITDLVIWVLNGRPEGLETFIIRKLWPARMRILKLSPL